MKSLGKPVRKILFFIKDSLPTAEEIAAAEAIGLGTVLRNATFVTDDLSPGQIEKCDAVAGAVPKVYAAKYPVVGEISVKTESTVPAAPAAPAAPLAPETPPAPPAAPDAPQPAISDAGWGQPLPPAPPVA